MKMGPQDDPKAFIQLLEHAAEAWGWLTSQWAVCLLLLLLGEAQLTAQQLPVTNLDLK